MHLLGNKKWILGFGTTTTIIWANCHYHNLSFFVTCVPFFLGGYKAQEAFFLPSFVRPFNLFVELSDVFTDIIGKIVGTS